MSENVRLALAVALLFLMFVAAVFERVKDTPLAPIPNPKITWGSGE